MLNAKEIRVWAGRKGSLDADDEYVKNVVLDSQRIADLASLKGIDVSFEYHGKTLTDTVESALELLKSVNRPNVNIYWQPAVGLDTETRLSNIKAIGKYISNVHVFNWHNIDRLTLESGLADWKSYKKALSKFSNKGKERYFLLEFVKDDSLDQFHQDAKTLKKLLKKA